MVAGIVACLSLLVSTISAPKASAEECVRAPHTAWMEQGSSASQSGTPGSTLYYHLVISNNDTGCGKSVFTFNNSQVPAGWNVAPLNGTESVDSPEYTTYSIWYTSPSNAYNGDYDLPINITRVEDATVVPIHLTYTVVGGQEAPDTTAPNLTILSPTAGTTVKKGSTVNISVAASDNVGVTRLDYYVDGFVVCIDYGTTCAWKTPTRKGTYQIEVRAQDAAGNVTSRFTSVNAL